MSSERSVHRRHAQRTGPSSSSRFRRCLRCCSHPRSARPRSRTRSCLPSGADPRADSSRVRPSLCGTQYIHHKYVHKLRFAESRDANSSQQKEILNRLSSSLYSQSFYSNLHNICVYPTGASISPHLCWSNCLLIYMSIQH